MLIIIIITAPNFFDGFSSQDVSVIITTPIGILTLIIIGLIVTVIILLYIIKCKRHPEQPQILRENNDGIDVASGGGNGFNDPTNEVIARKLEHSVYSNTTAADYSSPG